VGARVVLACIAVLASLGLIAVSASAETISFTKQGCEVWTAPESVVVQVAAVGAAGRTLSPAQGIEALGGRGDGVSGTIARNAGEDLYVCVDQGGGYGYYQTGGGWSGVILGKEENHAMVAVLAGGGGGRGWYYLTGGPTLEYHAGADGGDAGQPGETAGSCAGGRAGTESAGGAGATCTEPAAAGTEFQGGEASAYGPGIGGGGGGGGYYGGGGGDFWSLHNEASGGGGGSDFCGHGAVECATQAAAGTVHGAGAGSNEAHVTLTTTPLGSPTVTKVTPAHGPVTGGKIITLTGTNLEWVQSVHFGAIAASKYFVNPTGTEMAVLVPAQASAGVVKVTVTTVIATSAITKKGHYKYR
jgi:hypothetical protein